MPASGPVAGSLSHFAINADDVDAAQHFYGAVFGWQFTAWGPPGFFKISTAEDELPGVIGALQERRNLLPRRAKTTGFECTIAVDDVDGVVAAVRANGGRVLMEKATIPGVGHVALFADPSGNVVGAMQYE